MRLFLKILQGLFLLLLTGILCGAALLGTAALKWSQELPDLSQLDVYEGTSTSQIYANNSDLIGEILPIESAGGSTTDRIPVSLDQVSPAALQAIVSSEDDQFFKHYGFDIPAIVKAFYLLAIGNSNRGGSTITTQVIKNTLLADIATEQSIERKAKELMLAVELERRLTKTEILQRYINVVYWGGNFYGIRAASKAYFGKDPIELSLAEGLYLARLIPAPGSQYDDFAKTRDSMRVVLDNMVNQNIISQETADIAWREQIQPRGWQVAYDDGELVSDPIRTDETLEYSTSVSSSLAPHITWAVRNELTELFGQDRVFSQGGLRVYTTIDPEMQRAANEASRLAAVPPGAEVAIVGLNPATGEVYAMVGEKINDGEPVEEYNRAVAALRQPGSSFKPIVYGAAIEQGGFTQADVMRDEETSFQQPDGLPAWEPGNHDETFIGLGSLRHHLNISRNIPVAKLVEALTPEVVANRARQLGYESIQPYLSLSLGAFEITPLKHASALGAYANAGMHVEPYVIARVEDADGNILYEANPQRRQVWSPETAYIMLDMMHGNVMDLPRHGVTSFSSRAQIGDRYVAGKTGTTNDEKDIWFVGMTPGMVSAVWIGYDDPQPIPKRMPNNDRVTSSRQPIWIWHDFVAEAIKDRDLPTEYEIPENIDFAWFDVVTGAPRGAGAGNAVPGAFLRGTGPSGAGATVRKEIRITVPIDTRTGARATETTPPESVEWRAVRPIDLPSYY